MRPVIGAVTVGLAFLRVFVLSTPHNAIHEKLHHQPPGNSWSSQLRVGWVFTDYLAIDLRAFRNPIISQAFLSFCFCRSGQGQGPSASSPFYLP